MTGDPESPPDDGVRNEGAGRHQLIAAWAFGTLFLVFLIAVFFFADDETAEWKRPIVGFAAALLASLFTAFMVGSVNVKGRVGQRWTLQATGGVGVFALVFVGWSRVGPNEAMDGEENSAPIPGELVDAAITIGKEVFGKQDDAELESAQPDSDRAAQDRPDSAASTDATLSISVDPVWGVAPPESLDEVVQVRSEPAFAETETRASFLTPPDLHDCCLWGEEAWIAVGDAGTLLEVSSGGLVGRLAAPPEFHLLTVCASQAGGVVIAAGREGALLVSVDGGVSWSSLDSGTRKSLISSACEPDGSRAWIAGLGVLLELDPESGKVSALDADPADSNRQLLWQADSLWIVGQKRRGNPYVATVRSSLDSRGEELDVGGDYSDVVSLARTGRGDCFAFVRTSRTQDDFVVRHRPAGQSWRPFGDSDRCPPVADAWISEEGGLFLVAGGEGVFRYSGQGWAPVDTDVEPSPPSVAALAGSGDGSAVLAVGAGGLVLLSDHGARAWERLTFP